MSGMLAAGAAASFKMPSPLLADHHGSNDKLKITSVDAYPVKLWERSSQGKLPEFTSDFDPKRWRYTGPFAQLAGAIIVVIKTNQ